MTATHKESFKFEATKGSLAFLRWLIPLLLSGGLFTGGTVVANGLDKRVESLELTVGENSIELNGQKIELKNYNARIVDLQNDMRESRSDIKQILIILQKK